MLTDVSLVARRNGERFDFTTRASAGYTYDMLSDGPGSQSRVSLLFAEVADRVVGWYGRLGRQSGGSGGLLGTFDGVQAGYQLWPRLRVNGFFGYPVDSTREGPDSDRQFVGISADVGTFAEAWDLSVYAVDQQLHGMTDRQAVGTEVRFFRPGITVVGLADFDIHYSTLNTVLLLGTFALPARWTLNLNVDQRKSPGLSTRNAMLGQPVRRFDELFGLYSPEETRSSSRSTARRSRGCTRSACRVPSASAGSGRSMRPPRPSTRRPIRAASLRRRRRGRTLRSRRRPWATDCSAAATSRRWACSTRRGRARRCCRWASAPSCRSANAGVSVRGCAWINASSRATVDLAGVFAGTAGRNARQAPHLRVGGRRRARLARLRHELRGRLALLLQSRLSL